MDPATDLARQIAYFEQRFALNPRARLFAPLADLYRRTGQLDRALRLLQAGLEHHPHFISALIILAHCWLESGDEDSARETLRRVLRLDPDNVVALQLIADQDLRRGDWEAARERLARIVLLDPAAEEAAVALRCLGEPAVETPALPGATAQADGQAAGPWNDQVPDRPGDGGGELAVDLTVDSLVDEALAQAADQKDEEAAALPGNGQRTSPLAADEGGPADGNPAPGEHSLPPGVREPAESSEERSPRTSEGETGQAQPLATLTLADIYLAQGYRQKALEVLWLIRSRQPERQDVARRIAELENQLALTEPGSPGQPQPVPGTLSAEEPGGRNRERFETWIERSRDRGQV